MTSSSHHRFHIHLLVTEIRRLYWARFLMAVASSLVAIFIPLYFLNLGYSLSTVFLYFACYAVFSIVVCYPAMQLMLRIGANRSMALSNILQIPFFLSLITLPSVHWPLPAIALLAAIINETFWPAMHGNFSKAEDIRKGGRQVGMMAALVATATALAPAVGGFITTTFGFAYIYYAAAALFLISALPLFFAKEVLTERTIKLQPLSSVPWRRDLVANFGDAATQVVEWVIWPVLVFSIVTSYAVVGVLGSVAVIGSILAALYIGRREEVKGAKHYLRQGSTGIGLVNVLRTLASSTGHVFGLNVLAGITSQVTSTSYVTRYYQNANIRDRLTYVRMMEYSWSLAFGSFFLVLFLLSTFLPEKTVLILGLLIAAPASLLMQRMR